MNRALHLILVCCFVLPVLHAQPVTFYVHVIPEGAYPVAGGNGTLQDDLLVQGLIPTGEPYSSLGYSYVGGGAGTTTTQAGLLGNGQDYDRAVDWVVVEIRAATAPFAVINSKPMILRKDGFVTGLTASSIISMSVPAGNYMVAVRHRNHLGVMTAAPVMLANNASTVELAVPSAVMGGVASLKLIPDLNGGTYAMFSGDVQFNGAIQYTGEGNDRDPILVHVGGATPNNVVNGYSARDVNMDGQVKYTGADNDRDPILVNVGGATPNNLRVDQLP